MFKNSFFIKINAFFRLPFFTNKVYIASIWVVVAFVMSVKQYFTGSYNNYRIFKGAFFHTKNQLNLYELYPLEYFDHIHYGPIFSLVIAPFALLPDAIGLPLWGMFNAAVLVWAVLQLPLAETQKNAVLWICLHEFLTALLGVQFNPLMTAIILLSFVYIQKEKDFWAAMCIVLGTFIKLYGIVGLAFFFFSKNKIKFITALVFWSLVFFVLPMLLSSPVFIVQTYQDWFYDLVDKNNENTTLNSYQDICLMGMVRRFCHDTSIPNLPFLIGGVIIFGLQYLKINFYKTLNYRLLLLSSVLIFTVIFSSGSESPTYIIAFLGVAIWFVIQTKPRSKIQIFLFILAMILTSFSPSDLIPQFIKDQYIRPFALKALPCVLIWVAIVVEIVSKKLPKTI